MKECSPSVETWITHQMAPPGLTSASEQWWRKCLQNALTQSLRCKAPADQAAWLHEAARYGEGRLSIPPQWLEHADADTLAGFAIKLTPRPNGTLLIEQKSQLPPSLCRPLKLDASPRCHYEQAEGDGVLQRLCGFPKYRCATQKGAARAVLTSPPGSTLLVTMPTGSGKSLIFQLAILRLREIDENEKPVGVVVVPTVALAHSHVESAKRFEGLEGVKALTGDHSVEERTDTLLAFQRGEVPLLFMSPEMLFGKAREAILATCRPRDERPLQGLGKLSLFVVDEAHIIESWGRTFRPDFQRLPGLLAQFKAKNPDLRSMLLTATLGSSARQLLIQQYNDDKSCLLEISAKAVRYEFDIAIDHVKSRSEQTQQLLDALPALPRPMIVYTTEVDHAVALHAQIQAAGYQRTAVMTGRTSGSDRRDIVHNWAHDHLDIVVATSAFGMGIDKANVRCVVHVCVPENAARYYQEIGRAGRDGFQALAWCLWTDADVTMATNIASGQLLSNEVALKRWRAIVKRCREQKRIETDAEHVYMDVDLSAAHQDLDRHTGEKNRQWNRSLLNQLQRAGALEIHAVDDIKDHWRIRLNEAFLLSHELEDRLSDYLKKRDEEVSQSQEDTLEFIQLLQSNDLECFLTSVFELIEHHAPAQLPCGRCPNCLGVEPPNHQWLRGLDANDYWPIEANNDHGVFLIHPAHSTDEVNQELIEKLVRCHIQQFVVPSPMLESYREHLTVHSETLGVLMSSTRVADKHYVVAPLRTALILSSCHQTEKELERLVTRLRDRFNSRGGLLLIISPSGIQVEGRSINQVASKSSPYHENQLVEMFGRHS